MATAHFLMQGKGGVGKSLVASLLFQYLQRKNLIVHGCDTDPINSTFAGYKEFLVKAWNTGHEGGLATVHANSAREGLTRIEQLIAEGKYQPIKEVLADAIHLVVFMKKFSGIRRVAEIASVGFSDLAKDYTFDYQYRF